MSSTSEDVERQARRVEQALADNAELRQRLRAVESERDGLDTRLQRLRNVVRADGAVTGTVHDFKNLLTLIVGHSELLLKRLDAGDASRTSVEAIRKAAESGTELTRELLAAPRREPTTTVLDVNDVIGGVVQMLGGTLRDDVELITRLDPALGRVKANRAQLEQVMVNLAVNAHEAMPHGGRLVFETANVNRAPTPARRSQDPGPGQYVTIAVSDTGSGIDRSMHARVFERHFTTKQSNGGTGLGLSVVEDIVREHGGHVSVASALGQGSTFTVYLPRLADEAPAAAGGLAGQTRGGSETVLLVEDEPDLLDLMREILELQGYTVLEARDAVAAMAVSRDHHGPLHLVVTDVILPKLGVRDLLRELIGARPGIKVLYVSGHSEDQITRVVGPLRDAELLRKPFAVGVLAEKIREVLDRP